MSSNNLTGAVRLPCPKAFVQNPRLSLTSFDVSQNDLTAVHPLDISCVLSGSSSMPADAIAARARARSQLNVRMARRYFSSFCADRHLLKILNTSFNRYVAVLTCRSQSNNASKCVFSGLVLTERAASQAPGRNNSDFSQRVSSLANT